MALLGPLEDLTGLRLDPPLNHNFLVLMVESNSASVAFPGGGWRPSISLSGAFFKSGLLSVIGDALFGAYSEVSGLDMAMGSVKRQEGGKNDGELQFPGPITWQNLILKRGVSRVMQSGWDWLYEFGEGKVQRMDGLIMLMDAHHIPHNLWTFKGAFPVKFTGPTLKGTDNLVAVETLELAHEGLWQLSLAKVGLQIVKKIF